MKKFLSIILLGFLFIGNSYADEKMTVNTLLKQGYKITNEELSINRNQEVIKIISLKQSTNTDNNYFVCYWIVSPYFEAKTKCIKP